jgi:hypothetical protein
LEHPVTASAGELECPRKKPRKQEGRVTMGMLCGRGVGDSYLDGMAGRRSGQQLFRRKKRKRRNDLSASTFELLQSCISLLYLYARTLYSRA